MADPLLRTKVVVLAYFSNVLSKRFKEAFFVLSHASGLEQFHFSPTFWLENPDSKYVLGLTCENSMISFYYKNI